MSLRSKLIRLAHEKPELREKLLPLLQSKEARVSLRDWKPIVTLPTVFELTLPNGKEAHVEYVSGSGWYLRMPMNPPLKLKKFKYLTDSKVVLGDAINELQKAGIIEP